ncbi:MAG: hypothetical protein KA521_11380 [Crocinitomicaceae bacterium]|jgi:hypothetical protein|nr:hypothetical protein [Crocinitomicaceae bacterium]
MNKLILTFAVGSLLLYSCGNSTNEKLNNQPEVAEHNDHHHDDESEAIELNNGEKWVVNEEMKPFILDAEKIMNQHIESQSHDYQTLATQLKEKNSGLIKSCTMKGESHDELHKWLYPHIELIESLSKAESTEQANKFITDLQASFSTYNQYFQ